eukprot:3938566-Rhodomonas_salina.3
MIAPRYSYDSGNLLEGKSARFKLEGLGVSGGREKGFERYAEQRARLEGSGETRAGRRAVVGFTWVGFTRWEGRSCRE